LDGTCNTHTTKLAEEFADQEEILYSPREAFHMLTSVAEEFESFKQIINLSPFSQLVASIAKLQ